MGIARGREMSFTSSQQELYNYTKSIKISHKYNGYSSSDKQSLINYLLSLIHMHKPTKRKTGCVMKKAKTQSRVNLHTGTII